MNVDLTLARTGGLVQPPVVFSQIAKNGGVFYRTLT